MCIFHIKVTLTIYLRQGIIGAVYPQVLNIQVGRSSPESGEILFNKERRIEIYCA